MPSNKISDKPSAQQLGDQPQPITGTGANTPRGPDDVPAGQVPPPKPVPEMPKDMENKK